MSAATSAPPPAGPPESPFTEPPRKRWWMARRVLLGGLGVVLLSGGATAVVAFNEVNKVVEALGQNRAVKLAPKVLASTSRGTPQTLLLVGDDRRPPPKSNPGGFVLPHSNEMLLVHIDPSRPTISMLSIPRELQVTIYPPGGRPVVNRMNAAYTIGGIQLMTETIKRVLGVSINHVFVITFPKFRRAVDEMGCVYTTVDRRYYHINEPGGEQYFEVNLLPGYQLMCGREALEFVANRHEDTSLTRDARDQRFLLEAKAQYGPSLFEGRERFEHILGRAVETDLHGSGQVLDLLTLLVEAQGKPVRQVHFQVNLLPSFDTATPQQISESVQSFLHGTGPLPRHKLGEAVLSARHHVHHPRTSSLALSPSSTAMLAQARSLAPDLPFALEYPRVTDSYAAAVPETLRRYAIRDQRGRLHPAYVIVVDNAPLGQYYDVQGTSWPDPPLLSNPSQSVRIGSRTYELFYSGEAIRTVAWHDGPGTYWVENTLTNNVGPREMLAIAEETLPVVGGSPAALPRSSIPSASSVRLPARQTSTTGTATKLGALAGLLSVLALALLAPFLLLRQRELQALRAQVRAAMALEARQRPLLASAAASAPIAQPPSVPPPTSASAQTAPTAAREPSAPASVVQSPAPSYYRSRRRVRRGVLAASLAVAAAVAIALGLGLRGGGSSPTPTGPVPVAVFNATSKPGAAYRLAAALRAQHIAVAHLGNIKRAAGLGSGTYLLYPPGSEHQARRLAAQIRPAPTVAPMQAQVQSAVGHAREIVVVLD